MNRMVYLDFEGVITSGNIECNNGISVIPSPTPYIEKLLSYISNDLNRTIIVTSPMAIDKSGETKIWNYLCENKLDKYIDRCNITPFYNAYSLCVGTNKISFKGNIDATCEAIENFIPWWEVSNEENKMRNALSGLKEFKENWCWRESGKSGVYRCSSGECEFMDTGCSVNGMCYKLGNKIKNTEVKQIKGWYYVSGPDKRLPDRRYKYVLVKLASIACDKREKNAPTEYIRVAKLRFGDTPDKVTWLDPDLNCPFEAVSALPIAWRPLPDDEEK